MDAGDPVPRASGEGLFLEAEELSRNKKATGSLGTWPDATMD